MWLINMSLFTSACPLPTRGRGLLGLRRKDTHLISVRAAVDVDAVLLRRRPAVYSLTYCCTKVELAIGFRLKTASRRRHLVDAVAVDRRR